MSTVVTQVLFTYARKKLQKNNTNIENKKTNNQPKTDTSCRKCICET